MGSWRRQRGVAVAVSLLAVLVACCSSASRSGRSTSTTGQGGPASTSTPLSGIHKIQHIVIIQQENRSFDTYFGTYPGADGIPMKDGRPTVCALDPATKQCVAPYVDHADVNGGGPHSDIAAAADIHGGKMDGFVAQAHSGKRGCADPTNPACTNGTSNDVMGYHTQSDIPNYWAYANDFVLQDHMYEPNASWSMPAHLFLVSAWSAYCTRHVAASCTNADTLKSIPDRPQYVPAVCCGQPDRHPVA